MLCDVLDFFILGLKESCLLTTKGLEQRMLLLNSPTEFQGNYGVNFTIVNCLVSFVFYIDFRFMSMLVIILLMLSRCPFFFNLDLR